MSGIQKFKAGNFNTVEQTQNVDGSVTITISSRKYPEIHKITVIDLYKPTEQVLSDEVITRGS